MRYLDQDIFISGVYIVKMYMGILTYNTDRKFKFIKDNEGYAINYEYFSQTTIYIMDRLMIRKYVFLT